MIPNDIAPTFWRLLGRVLERPVAPGRYSTQDLPEWDSLRHVELVFELEEAFELDIPQDDIAKLYSDTDDVLAYLRRRVAASQ